MAKKAAKKKAPAKKAPAAAPKVKAISEKLTKTQIVGALADSTGLTKKQVSSVMDAMNNLIEGSIKKRGAGEFTIPGMMKITTVRKPAVKARKGINPFTGEETMFKAKPARNVVKIRLLKNLKDMV